jgi:hypothetical protein
VLREHAREPDTVVVDELGLCRGSVRVDVAAVNGILHGYEIKSDRDSLHRLDGQVEVYSKVLDRATLVVGPRHIETASQMVPDWWGILLVQGEAEAPTLKMVRRGRKNRGVDARALVELLWLDDALALLEAHGAARGVRGKPRRVVWDRVCEHVSRAEIADAVRRHLKETARKRGAPPSA